MFIWFGYNDACKGHSVGIVKFKMFNGPEFILFNVRYVPEHKWNWLSIIMFDDLGYFTRIECGVVGIFSWCIKNG